MRGSPFKQLFSANRLHIHFQSLPRIVPESHHLIINASNTPRIYVYSSANCSTQCMRTCVHSFCVRLCLRWGLYVSPRDNVVVLFLCLLSKSTSSPSCLSFFFPVETKLRTLHKHLLSLQAWCSASVKLRIAIMVWFYVEPEIWPPLLSRFTLSLLFPSCVIQNNRVTFCDNRIIGQSQQFSACDKGSAITETGRTNVLQLSCPR